jgi:gliding motility-associated-like protein
MKLKLSLFPVNTLSGKNWYFNRQKPCFMKKIFLYCIALLFVPFIGCDKENGVHVHCDDLVNDVLPAGDQGAVFVANAFTPNGDGINDLFKPYAFNVTSIHVRVYDKNSNLVFESTQQGGSWNPSLAGNETFYFRVEAVTMTNSRIGQCGEVRALFCYPVNSGINYKFEDQLTPLGFTGVTAENLPACN